MLKKIYSIDHQIHNLYLILQEQHKDGDSSLFVSLQKTDLSFPSINPKKIEKPLGHSIPNPISPNRQENLNDHKYVSPDEDYDQICNNNKDNTIRRAVGGFFVNALKHDLVPPESIIEIIEEVQEKITNYMDSEDQTEIIDELSELVGEMLPPILNILDDEEYGSVKRSMIANVAEVSKLSAKNYPSLSNKTVFKHMDILECDEVENALGRLA